MAFNPLPLFAVVMLTLGFQAAVFGTEVITSNFPALRPVSFGTCGGNALDIIACWTQNVGNIIIDFLGILAGIILLLVNVLTFNIPGLPMAIRGVGIAIVSLSIAWSIATLVRGN